MSNNDEEILKKLKEDERESSDEVVKNTSENNESIDEVQDKVEDDDNKKKVNVKKEILSWVKIVVGAFVVAFILSNFVILNATVPTGSMISTINKGDHIVGFRLSYLFSDPKRGDIVMFDSPIEKGKVYVKRIIGIPGDKIKISNNQLYINGELQEEDYIKNGWTKSTGTEEYEVPSGCYFMMGDNRDGSYDSRAWGYVKKSAIIAKAFLKYYPDVDILD